jgi:signal transduction histidine kinase
MSPETLWQHDNGMQDSWGFAQILEHIDIGVLVLDISHQRVDYSNPSFIEMLQDDVLCADFSRLNQLLLGDSEGAEQNLEKNYYSSHFTHNGRLFGFSVYRAAEPYRCFFIRDITEKSRFESIAQAVNVMDNIGFIFSGIRHEIGNPLNSLKMALSVLRQNIDNTSPEMLKEYLDRGMADVERISYLLKALKAFSLYDNIEIKSVRLIEFMEKFICLVERDFHSKGIFIKTEIPLDLPYVAIDSRALHQALLNVFSNAADALSEIRKPQILIRAEVSGSLVSLKIFDNGCGIHSQQLKHLFQPFNTSKPKGNGLGLVITRKLLAMMNADIEISSRAGQGTLATIRLAIADDQL